MEAITGDTMGGTMEGTLGTIDSRINLFHNFADKHASTFCISPCV